MKNYKLTSLSCYIGYAVQALIITLPSLLFTVFYNRFSFSLFELGNIIIIIFVVQIITDALSAVFISKMGYRAPAIFAHICCFLGLVGLSVLPNVLSFKYLAVCISVFVSSIGGGLIEVLISPLMEALPTDKKAASMSFLHSFFCWGELLTVLLTTLYFYIFKIGNWSYLPLIWSVVPFVNIFLFIKAPLPSPVKEEKATGIKSLLKNKFFLLFLVLMLCSGAAEQSMSQWASLFAEAGLGVSKSVGDLLGISLFALLMGASRLFYGLKSETVPLARFILISALLCITGYLLTVFSPKPVLSLFGCALCGLSVGIMWPGTFSLAAKNFSGGKTTMFALLAFAGDIGCALGPGAVGLLSDIFRQNNFCLPVFSGDINSNALKFGLMFATLFPVILLFTVKYISRKDKE